MITQEHSFSSEEYDLKFWHAVRLDITSLAVVQVDLR
jgi:hypothetical protein